MTRYTWPAPGRDESNIVGSRLGEEIRLRVGTQLAGYNHASAKDVALAELLAGTPEVVHVKSYGAVGDGVTDDTAAIQAACDAASAAFVATGYFSQGSIVSLPAGDYRVSASIEPRHGVTLRGSGSRCTSITVAPGVTLAGPVITSNLTGAYGNGYAHATWIEGLTVRCAGNADGIAVGAWNESCGMRDVEVFDFTGRGFVFQRETNGNKRTQMASFHNLRALPHVDGADAMFDLDGVHRCFFQSITGDMTGGATAPTDAGLLIRNDSLLNVFVNPHMEDCSIPYDIGQTSACDGNVFVGYSFNAPQVTPAGTTIGTITDDTIGILIRSGTESYSFQHGRDYLGYDWAFYDVDRSQTIAGSARTLGRIEADKDGGFLRDGFIRTDVYVGTRITQSASTDNLNVNGCSIVTANTVDNSIVIGGLRNGVEGQRVTIYKGSSANTLTIEHQESTGDQKINTPDTNDIVLTTFGGVDLVYSGTNWFVVGR
jgi:hypothetical protein